MSKKDLHSKLDRLRGHIVSKPKAPPAPEELPERYRVLAERLDGSTVCNDLGGFCLIRKFFPAVYTHGEIALADFAHRSDLPACAFTLDDDPARLAIDRLLFFDLETIGLGGAGTAAFLVGIGSLIDHGFEVRQYLLPDYDDEAALLTAVAEEFTPETILVSYNGAAFDLPILTDRFTINRVGREIPHARHLDLLHVVRRLFKRRLRQCDLGNIEKDVFGFRRFDDIPGFLVPSVYFDWLGDHKLDDMEKVLQHNRYDIISLYFLAAVLGEVFESRGERLSQIDDLHSLARLFNRRRDLDNTLDLNRRVSALGGDDLAPDVLLFHAQTHKRRGKYDAAVEIWKNLADLLDPTAIQSNSPLAGGSSDQNLIPRVAFRACLELAIYYEHRAKDLSAALDYTRRAERCPDLNPSRRRSLQKRRERLLKKQAR